MALFTGDQFVAVDVKYPEIQRVVDNFNEQALPYKKNVELLEQIAQYDGASADRAQELLARANAAKRLFKNELSSAQMKAEEREKKALESADGHIAALEELAKSFTDTLKKMFDEVS